MEGKKQIILIGNTENYTEENQMIIKKWPDDHDVLPSCLREENRK